MPSLSHCQGVGTEKPRALFNQASWFELALVDNLGMILTKLYINVRRWGELLWLSFLGFRLLLLKGKNDLQVSFLFFSI